MPFPRKLLNDGEEVVLDLRPHWWFMSQPTAALVASLVLLALVLSQAGGDATWEKLVKALVGLLALGCVGWFVVRYLRWTTTNFVVTTDRLVFRRGVLSKSGIEIPLDKINTVFFNQTIFERMLGAGDLRIESAGESGTESFSDIRKPSAVQNEIYRQMESNENRKFDRINPAAHAAPSTPAAPAAPPAGPAPTTQPAPGGGSIPEQLERLDELRKRGVISDEEFAAKKTELLRRM